MIYLDEEVIIRLNNLNPSKSGQYLYQVKKDGVLIFSGYTYLDAEATSKEFNISDICAHYRYDCRDFFENTAAYNVETSFISTYEVTLIIGSTKYSEAEEVAHIYRYPTNSNENYIINKDYFTSSYMPLLQSTKIKSMQANDTIALYETTFLPHYPKKDTSNYGIGVVLVSENEEIPVMLPNGDTTTIENNSYIPLNEFYHFGNSLDVTLGSFSYTRYNILINNITYNVAVPAQQMISILRYWLDDIQPSFATDIATTLISALVGKKTSITLEVEGASDVASLFSAAIADTIPESNGVKLFTFGEVSAVAVEKTCNTLSYSGLLGAPTIKSWNGSGYSVIAKTADNAIRLPYVAEYIQLGLINGSSEYIKTTINTATSGKASISFVYSPKMKYLEVSFRNTTVGAANNEIGFAQWALASLKLEENKYYTLEIEYNTNTKAHAVSYSFAKNWVFGEHTLQPIAAFDECPARYYLQWQDRYGGIQSQPFTGNITYQESFTRSNIINYKNQKIITQNVVQPKWELSSGWIAEEDFPYYESLFISSYLKLYDTQKDVSYLVNITNNSFTEKNWNNTKKLLSLTLNLEAIKPQNILS